MIKNRLTDAGGQDDDAKSESVTQATLEPETEASPSDAPKRRVRAKRSRRRKTRGGRPQGRRGGGGGPKYPRHSLEAALRVPRAILDQNAGRPCTDREAAGYLGVSRSGPFATELASAIKYMLLERPQTGKVQVTDLAKKILRPQSPKEDLAARREAILQAPDIGAVYAHYRGENLPERAFFANALVDRFGIPAEKVDEFASILRDNLKSAMLLEEHEGRARVLDVSSEPAGHAASEESIKRLGKTAKIEKGDTCFVMMPFAHPVGRYYELLYEPAIQKAGLVPVRADADIFATGKIMDQVWDGINRSKVLVADLTDRNPNVFYELGLAHALEKPVVLVSAEGNVPFDLHHIRVIYYDVSDPFWGEKLINKIAENILSAVNNPEEAIFKRVKT